MYFKVKKAQILKFSTGYENFQEQRKKKIVQLYVEANSLVEKCVVSDENILTDGVLR